MDVTTRRGGIAPASRLTTRSRLPKTSSVASCSRGSFSQAGKTSGVIPEKTAMSSRKSSTSPTWARTMTRVVGACKPSAAVTSPAAEPQAPSIVAARPFFECRQGLGKPRGALDLPGQVLEIDRRCCRRRDVGWEGSGFARDSGHRIFA